MSRGVYQFCAVQQKVVPIEEVIRTASGRQGAAHFVINDEMPATKHPLTGEMITSKAKFREITKARGYEEVGTAYDNGYEPEKILKEKEREFNERFSRNFRERLNAR